MILKNKDRLSKDILIRGRSLPIMRTLLVPADKESAERLDDLEGVGGIYPLDQKLGIDKAPFKATYKMVAEIAWEGISCRSYKEAAKRLSEKNRFDICHTQVKRVTDYVGKLVFGDDCRQAEEAKNVDTSKIDKRKARKDTIYVQFDGSFYQENIENGPGCEWKECKIGIIFKDSDLYHWANGTEVKHKDIVGYIGKAEDFKYHLKAALIRNGFYQCRTRIFITDGARWILPFLQKNFPDCQYILDKYHAKENAGEFASAIKRSPKQRKDLTDSLFEMIDNGDVDGILNVLEPYKDFKRQGVVNFYEYVSRLGSCMHYDEYEKNDWMVGSGNIESCHRYTMQDRMKRPGQHWNRQNGQGILSLKCRKESNHWDEVVELIRQDYIRRRASKTSSKE